MADKKSQFAPYLAGNYLNTNGGVMLAQLSTGAGGQPQQGQGQQGSWNGPDENSGLGQAYNRFTGKLVKPIVPGPDVMEEHYKFRLAEMEKQKEASFSEEMAKKMAPIIVGAGVGSRYGAWGALAGGIAAVGVESMKKEPDPLNELPDEFNGLGREIP